MLRTIAPWFLALTLLGCGGGPTPTEPDDRSTSSGGENGQRPRSSSRIITHGDSETLVARYAPAGASAWVVRMQVDMAMALRIGENDVPRVELPTVHYEIAFDAPELTSTGTIRMRFRATDVLVEGTSGLPTEAHAQFEQSLATMRGFAGTYEISARGELISNELDVPEGVPESARAQLEQLQSNMSDLVLVWPEDPIGVGTTFEVEKTVHTGGIASRQRTRYRVLAIEGSRVSLEVSIRTNAPPQDMPTPAAAPQARVYLTAMSGEGSGTSTIDLRTLRSDAASRARVTLDATVTADGNTTPMSTTIEVAIEMR